jgi:arsenite methyltransferase
VVRKRYAEVAGGINRVLTITGAPRSRETAQNLGYKAEDLRAIPDATLSSFAGCGNPLAIEEMREGEVVLDLGSGAGLDCFLSAAKVGPWGKVIGLDMTKEMLSKAEATRKELGLKNVEFRMGELEKMPVEDSSVDVIISNCVINLSPEKEKVFREAYRVLKPGGRMMVSDMVLEKELPPEVRKDPLAWASCIAGAVLEKEYLGMMEKAGFRDIEVLSRTSRKQVISAKIRAVKKP